jgi:hypothetical protein
MAREAPRIVLDVYELIDLQRLARAPSTPQALAFRTRLELRCAHAPVSKWRGRFRRHRLGGLHDLPRSGRPAAFPPGGPAQGPRPGDDHAARRRRAHVALVAG